jgi:hypothetical protein
VPSNSSGPGYNSKSLSNSAAESPAERDPRAHSPLVTVLWGVLAVVVQGRLCLRDGISPVWPGLIALVSLLVIALGAMSLWRRTGASRVSASDPAESSRLAGASKPGAKTGHVVILAGGLLGFVVSVPFGVWTLSAAVLVLVLTLVDSRPGLLMDFIAAVLASALFLGTATAFGRTILAGYPAALAFFFFLAWGATIGVETWKTDASGHRVTIATLLGPRMALAVAGIFFFIFGIITTWPFLNGLYGPVYFWIVALGVDLPLLWMWGKLRGRDRELSQMAVARFNRLARWLTFVVLIGLFLA